MTLIDEASVKETQVETPIRRRRVAPRVVPGAVLVFIGLLWLLQRAGAIDWSVTAVLALATLVVGVALMLLAGDGPHPGLIVFGTILALVTATTAIAPFEGFQGGVGDRTVELTKVADIHPDYDLAMGDLTIDLRHVDDFDAPTVLNASVGIGELVILVPNDIPLSVEAQAGVGEIAILGKSVNGAGVDDSYRSPGFDPSQPGLTLVLDVFTGTVEVTDE